MSEENYIQEESASPLKTTLIVGGILGVFMLIYNYIFIWTGNMEGNKIYSYIQYFIILGFGLAAIKIHRDKNLGGEISYGKAFLTSLLTVLWFSIIVAAFTYFYFKINPEKIDEIMREGMKAMEKKVDKGEMREEDFEKGKEILQMMNGPMPMAFFSFMGCLLPGIITSLIAAAFHKLLKSNKA
ncbi:MAG: DUF4199 domain-containing protein [Bacteroidota bacterium]|nr:DUF4199 domain-containing protein [Bacteroidota bacterium]